MTIRRKLWVLLLAAAMLVTMLPAAAFADDTGSDETKAPEPKWVVYEGPVLRGVLGTDTLLNLETSDVSNFIVTYTDGSTRTFTYRQKDYKDESIKDEDYSEYTVGAFIPDDDPDQDPLNAKVALFPEVKQSSESSYSFKKEWNNNIELEVLVQYVNEYNEVVQKTLPAYVDVLCAPDFYPLAVEFIPAEGFSFEVAEGYNYLTEEDFYGAGNAFRVSYYGWKAADPDKGIEEGFENFTTTYTYGKGKDVTGEEVEGFFSGGGNINKMRFNLVDGVFVDLPFNKQKNVVFTYTEYVEEYDEDVSVEFKVPVKATKHCFEADYPVLTYTGKPIKVTSKNFKVYDANGKRIPAEAYNVQTSNNGKMGWYDAKITLNDKFANKKNYIESINASYSIGPKAPTIKKPVSGKKKLTVKWKKLTDKKLLKDVDGYYIELSTDKAFMENYKRVWVKKSSKAFKKGTKVVKGLKKNRKYYVRMYASKKIKQGGETFKIESKYSKVKAKKTKK